jgi:hypothetical protein
MASDAEAPAAGGRYAVSGDAASVYGRRHPALPKTTAGSANVARTIIRTQEGGKVTFLLFCGDGRFFLARTSSSVRKLCDHSRALFAPSSKRGHCCWHVPTQATPCRGARVCHPDAVQKNRQSARTVARRDEKRRFNCLRVRVACTGTLIFQLCLDQSEIARKYGRHRNGREEDLQSQSFFVSKK